MKRRVSRSARPVVYLSDMKRIAGIVPTLLFFAVLVGQALSADVQRTSSPAARGVTEADFPRVQMLADGLCTCEALTGSDLFVRLPDERILFATEVFLNHMFSGFRSAYPRDWIDTIDAAEKLNPDLYVPGHGFVDDAAVLQEEWDAHKAHVRYVYDEVS